ncbi:hypothetical protein [Kitasatospora sp. NPDC085879]|uniref:hypothetical protein n=1 Tax=Kitasatospora sp. NPDC085879 TaxID=3154769 RepID=UPI0034465887
MDRATQVKLKFDRSRYHISSLSSEIGSYLAREPFAVHDAEDAQGDLVYRVTVREHPPIELSLLLGDAIHNARAALDYLARQLVEAGGGAPNRDTAFPVAASATAFADLCKKALKGALPAAITGVESLHPYLGGDDRFWKLHKLDIADKHHLLLTVGAAHASVNVSFGLPGGEEAIVLPLLPVNRAYPLQDGTEIFRVMKAARESATQGVGGAHSFSFDVAFGDGVVVSGEPVMPTINNLVGGIEGAVAPLYQFIQ